MNSVKFDPRTKVVLCIITCIFSTHVSHIFLNLLFIAFLSAVLIASCEYKKTLTMICVVAITLVLENIIKIFESNVFLMFFGLLTVAVRMYTPIIMTLLLIFQTTKISEFMSAFEKLKVPSSFMIPFAVFFRFIPTLEQEWQGIKKAMLFRDIEVNVKTLILKPITTIEYMIVPLLASSVSILDEMVAASLVRGLDSQKERSCYIEIKLKFYDYLVLIIGGVFVIIVKLI